jgi:hypothetical protein
MENKWGKKIHPAQLPAEPHPTLPPSSFPLSPMGLVRHGCPQKPMLQQYPATLGGREQGRPP